MSPGFEMATGGRDSSLTPTMKNLKLDLAGASISAQRRGYPGESSDIMSLGGSVTERGTAGTVLKDQKSGFPSRGVTSGSLTQRDSLFMKPQTATPRIDK
jgi:hypothetical protein